MAFLGLGLWYFLKPASVQVASGPVTSLAVMPLKNLTGDPSNDYLSDGVTDSLIESLATMDSLAVIARDSSFAFKGEDVDNARAGTALGVQSLLTGSVEKDGEKLRITVRLINVADGRVLWATETRKASNEIFSLQDEITRNIVQKLKLRKALPDSELSKRPTENIAAYNMYLKGRYFWHLQTEQDLNKSIEYFTQAAMMDPRFAIAYCGLADAYSSLAFYFRPPNDAMPKARFYAAKALEIDPESADAHLLPSPDLSSGMNAIGRRLNVKLTRRWNSRQTMPWRMISMETTS